MFVGVSIVLIKQYQGQDKAGGLAIAKQFIDTSRLDGLEKPR
jgi:hypothetical protein